MKKHIVLMILCSFIVSSCMTQEPTSTPFVTFQPKDLQDGWIVTTPSSNNADSLALINAFSSLHNDPDIWQIRSVSVFQHGKLLAESYLKSELDRTQERQMWSCTKQVLGLLVGIALDKGIISSLDAPLSQYLPQAVNYSDKKDITLRNLLTMRSGINYTNDGTNGQTNQILQQNPESSVQFILERPMIAAPGETFRYNDGDPHLVAAMLQNAVGKPLDEWAREVLFSKLSIQRLQWIRYRDGITMGGFGIVSTPREMAKIAQCVLNGGVFAGERIVSEEWIRQMTTPQVQTSQYSFGFMWWIAPERSLYFMSGNGGQYMICYPEKQAIVVLTSEPNTLGKFRILNTRGLNIAEPFAAALR